MVSVLKSENSEKSTYKNSPNNSLDQKPKGRKENERLCKLFSQIRTSKYVILNPRF